MALIIAVACLQTVPCEAGERIWLEAAINGKKVRLVFDSGSSDCVLTTEAAQKLRLKFIPAATKDPAIGVLAGNTDECLLNLGGTDCKTSFILLDWPPYARADFDGLIGWPMFSRSVFRIDAAADEIEFLTKLPKRTSQWAQLTLLTNSSVLDLQVLHSNGSNGVLSVDTGSYLGLELPPQQWTRWKEMHPQIPITLGTAFSPNDGFYVYEEAWADQISVGPIVLTGVPIASSGYGNVKRLGEQYEGTLGLAALKRLDVIIDGYYNGVAFLRSKKTAPLLYSYNRLGAVFVPTFEHTNEGVARVVKGSPAYEAGIHNGDVLLKVDDAPAKGWDWSWLHRFNMKAGTKLKLTLKREGKEFQTTATLREILRSNSKANN